MFYVISYIEFDSNAEITVTCTDMECSIDTLIKLLKKEIYALSVHQVSLAHQSIKQLKIHLDVTKMELKLI